MKKIILVLLFLYNTILFSKDFFTIDEFISTHKSEQIKMNLFDTIVQNKPIKISFNQKKPVKISMIYPAGEISDYWRRSKKSFEKRLKLLNIYYEFDDHFLKSTNLHAQSKKIREALQKKSDYLIFTLDVNAHKKLITQLLSRKKPKLIIQNVTTPLKEWEGNQPFLYVGFDHIEGTKLLANYYKKKFPDGGKYAMLYFKKGYISEVRGDSFINIMKKDKNFLLVDSFYTEGNSKKSFSATNNILEKTSDVDFLYSCSTDISIGAVEAIANSNIPPLVNGWGGGSKELDLIKEKKLEVTVMRMNDDNGIAMAEAIKLDLEKRYKKLPLIYSGKFVIIDKNTDHNEIEKYKKRAFRYSD